MYAHRALAMTQTTTPRSCTRLRSTSPTRTARVRRASARPKQTRTVPPRRADEQRQQKARKASFMEKTKGEAKVLLGKIEGKHEQVEEGQRMKAGEAAGGKA